MKKINSTWKLVALLVAVVIAYFGWQSYKQESEFKQQERLEAD